MRHVRVTSAAEAFAAAVALKEGPSVAGRAETGPIPTVFDPLPDVTVHIVKLPRAGCKARYRGGSHESVVAGIDRESRVVFQSTLVGDVGVGAKRGRIITHAGMSRHCLEPGARRTTAAAPRLGPGSGSARRRSGQASAWVTPARWLERVQTNQLSALLSRLAKPFPGRLVRLRAWNRERR